MNQVLEQFKNKLAESWNATDKKLHAECRAFYEEHKNEKFESKYYNFKIDAQSYFIEKHCSTKHEREVCLSLYGVEEKNMKDAEKFVENLEQKITAITGEIKEIINYDSEQGTGWKINGEKANAIVLQIYAGGYNIVRLHIRNLIKKVK